MKILNVLFFILLLATTLEAQKPVTWSFSYNQIEGTEFELIFKADIQAGWYVYSMYLPSDDGPVATAVTFESEHQKLVEKATESASDAAYKISGHDETFDMELIKYKHDLTIKQRVIVTDKSKPVKGYVTFMTCDNERCLPPSDVEFSFALSNSNAESPNKEEMLDQSTEKSASNAASSIYARPKIQESLKALKDKGCQNSNNVKLTKNKAHKKCSDCSCPSGIQLCFKDYEAGLAYAKSVKKPIILDFNGFGSEVNRKMEDNVWVKSEINKYFNEDYVLISLYVDDRTKIKEEKDLDGKSIKTLGQKWAIFQQVNFGQIYQPFYVLLAPDETVLNEPIGANFDAKIFEDFLKCGLQQFEQWKKK